MREFSPSEFGAFLAGVVVEIDAAQREALEKAAEVVEKEAKRVIGTYDYGWPDTLADNLGGPFYLRAQRRRIGMPRWNQWQRWNL